MLIFADLAPKLFYKAIGLAMQQRLTEVQFSGSRLSRAMAGFRIDYNERT